MRQKFVFKLVVCSFYGERSDLLHTCRKAFSVARPEVCIMFNEAEFIEMVNQSQ